MENKLAWGRAKDLGERRCLRGSTCCETGSDGVGVARGNLGTSLEILWLRLQASHCFRGGPVSGQISYSKMHVVWLCSVVAMQCG